MEWMNKGDRPAPATQPAASYSSGKKGSNVKFSKGIGFATVILLFSATVVLVGVLLYSVLSSNSSQSSYVDNSELQAVFLNGGQVYFGNIKNLNSQYMRLVNIYYLRVNQTVQPNGSTTTNDQNVSLVKLGCELHGPTDQMLIENAQVVFWENLKPTGQVAKAVEAFEKANPNGQSCSTSNSTATTGATTTPATTTGTTDDTTTSK